MSSYDNPAGRLHELLRRLSDANAKNSLLAAWAEVLEVPQGDVQLRLGGVGQLVADVQEAVDKSGEEALIAPVARYRAQWANAIFPQNQAFAAPLENVKPEESALETLALVATHLHAVAPDGKMPDEDALGELKGQLQDLLEQIDQASDLDEAVKQLLATRLSQMLQAIEHVRIGGPNAVRFATEALIGAIDVQQPKAWRSETGKRVAVVLGAIWVAFSAGPTLQNSLEAWSDVFHGELGSGVSQSAAPLTPEPEDSDGTSQPEDSDGTSR